MDANTSGSSSRIVWFLAEYVIALTNVGWKVACHAKLAHMREGLTSLQTEVVSTAVKAIIH